MVTVWQLPRKREKIVGKRNKNKDICVSLGSCCYCCCNLNCQSNRTRWDRHDDNKLSLSPKTRSDKHKLWDKSWQKTFSNLNHSHSILTGAIWARNSCCSPDWAAFSAVISPLPVTRVNASLNAQLNFGLIQCVWRTELQTRVSNRIQL